MTLPSEATRRLVSEIAVSRGISRWRALRVPTERKADILGNLYILLGCTH